MSNMPTIKIDLSPKDGTTGTRTDLCAFWKSKNGRPGSYSAGSKGWSVYDKDTKVATQIVKLVLADGREIMIDDYWTNLTHWDEKNGAGAPAPAGLSFPTEQEASDDIPF